MRMIFHHPLPVSEGGASASGIRPVRMLRAFEEAGYSVDVIAGNARQRAVSARAVKKNLDLGVVYDFLYSESSTLPTLLTESSRIPIMPETDFGLFRACKSRNVPIGLFYRDIYWMFSEFQKKQGWLKFKLVEFFYKYDLKQYNAWVDKIYLPSIQMASYIPFVGAEKFDTLPPGHSGSRIKDREGGGDGLHLLYVGGMSALYEMHDLFKAVADIPDVHLTICTRELDWRTVKSTYSLPLPSNVEVVHKSGSDLEALYEAADVAVLFVRPHAYRDFAVPFKLFEYIGERKPVIASEGTMAGTFVKENGVGWTVPYDSANLSDLLRSLLEDPSILEEKSIRLNELALRHTWRERAKKVIRDMAEIQDKRMQGLSRY